MNCECELQNNVITREIPVFFFKFLTNLERTHSPRLQYVRKGSMVPLRNASLTTDWKGFESNDSNSI